MKIVFVSNKKQKFYTETIEKLVSIALYNYEFDLAEDGAILMGDICGLDGLNYARSISEKRIKELIKELESEKEEWKN